MSKLAKHALITAACGAALIAVAAAQAQSGAAPAMQSANALAFAPNGVLLVGDSLGGALFSVETGDNARTGPGKTELNDVGGKIAALLGTTADQVTVNDMAVNPISGNIYLAVSRGSGPTASPVLLKVARDGALSEVNLKTAKVTRVSLVDKPAETATAAQKMQTVTDLGFVDGKVIVAGLSNEEFSSSMRAVPYPLSAASKGAGIEIYHTAHARFETASPIRTFMTYDLNGKPHVLAAYTCTPLVRIPVADLQPGSKVKGVTIAELGNRNQPLDMISYKRAGKDYILMSNSARGVMKMTATGLEGYAALTTPVADKAGVPYETIASLTGVRQLDKLNDDAAIVLVADAAANNALSLRTVAMP